MAGDVDQIMTDLLTVAMDATKTAVEQQAARDALAVLSDQAFADDLANFRKGTRAFLDVAAKLVPILMRLQPGNAVQPILDRLGILQSAVHDGEGMRTTFSTSPELEQVHPDEVQVPPAAAPAVLNQPVAPMIAGVVPHPVNSKLYGDLAAEYDQFFAAADWKNASVKAEAGRYAASALLNKPRYSAVGDPLGIPWWFIAGTHLLEASFNFTTHLHNGDPLTARTFRVPAGRPKGGNPPFTWEFSATDAMQGDGYANLTSWSLSRALFRWETFNGFGYRSRGIPTPYLWSFTTLYASGKFIGDGVYSASAVSKQCGAAAFLKALLPLDPLGL